MLWIKTLHIISMVTWFSGLFYLPRLFVYHTMSDDDVSQKRFIIMEKKLAWFIMTPSAVVTTFSGLWLVQSYGFHGLWLHLKMTSVLFLLVYHGYCLYLVSQFSQSKNSHSTLFYRIFNEVPVFFLVAIVFLVEFQLK